MITEEALRNAHFRGRWICLDCGEEAEGEEMEDENVSTNCPRCGSEYFASGYQFTMILNRVEKEG